MKYLLCCPRNAGKNPRWQVVNSAMQPTGDESQAHPFNDDEVVAIRRQLRIENPTLDYMVSDRRLGGRHQERVITVMHEKGRYGRHEADTIIQAVKA